MTMTMTMMKATTTTTTERISSYRQKYKIDTIHENNNSSCDDQEQQQQLLLDKNGKVLVDELIKTAAAKEACTPVVDEKEMDAFLAGELNKMSIQERQKVFEEIHGVDTIVEETPELVSQSLQSLQNAIDKIQPKNAYEMAESIDAEYVHSDSFRLTFLRADMFDSVKAAKRLCTFFECRLALFGIDLLTRPLTLDDLNVDDIACLKSGYFQILPQRDTTNRAVLVNVQGMFQRSYKLALNMQRMYHYMHCTMAEDILTQIHGFIFVCYQIGSFHYDPPPDLFNGNSNLMLQGCPLRMCGMHMCLENPIMKAISRVVLAASGSTARARYRFHDCKTSSQSSGSGGSYGSHIEIHYKLLSFGIPVDLFPITNDGKLKKTAHTKWLTMRQMKEELIYNTDKDSNKNNNFQKQQFASSSSSNNNDDNNNNKTNILRIDLPGRNDVLMGKGKPLQESSGNVSLRALVNVYVPEYEACQKYTKFVYVDKVVDEIRLIKGGRFLKRDQTGHLWILANDDEIKEKISKTFTSEQAKAKKKNNNNKKINTNNYGNNKKQQQQQRQQQRSSSSSGILPAAATSSSRSICSDNTNNKAKPSSSLWSATANVQDQQRRAVVVDKYYNASVSSRSTSTATATTTNTDYLSDSSGGKRSREDYDNGNNNNSNNNSDDDSSSFWDGCFGVFGSGSSSRGAGNGNGGIVNSNMFIQPSAVQSSFFFGGSSTTTNNNNAFFEPLPYDNNNNGMSSSKRRK